MRKLIALGLFILFGFSCAPVLETYINKGETLDFKDIKIISIDTCGAHKELIHIRYIEK